MKKKKVFNMTYSLGAGGVERFSVSIFKHIDHNKIEMDFITKQNKTEFYDYEFAALGGKKIPLSNNEDTTSIKSKYTMLKKSINVLRKGKYDICYFNVTSPADILKYPLLCKVLGIKHIFIHSHNSSDNKKGFIHKIFNQIGRKAVFVLGFNRIACSNKAALWMYGKNCRDNYIEIKNGIDVSDFRYNFETRKKLREKYDVDNDTILICQVGRFTDVKNQKFTIEILKSLKSSNNKIKAILIGDGILKPNCERIVKEYGLSEDVWFFGNRNNVNELLQMMDIFVMPSKYEGLPVSAIEAQASGIVCVLSDAITKEVDITGNVRFLPLDIELWKKELLSLVPYHRMDVSDRIIRAGYDISQSAKKIEGLFLSVEGKV